MKPHAGKMYWWRQKGALEWRFGYCSLCSGGLVRMSAWNGDTTGGVVVDPVDIDWKEFQ